MAPAPASAESWPTVADLSRGAETPAAPPAPIIRRLLFELTDVEARRGGEPVLRSVSASLPVGTSCVLGPSGSGKSTLLRLLNRLADPDAGRITYRGEDIRDRNVLELRREVCLVPQLPALLDGSVADNLDFAAGLAGREPDRGRVLSLAGLDPSFADRNAGRLSVGERQRVMLARCLALEPRVLLLDEPTSALDEAARNAIEATLARLVDELQISVVLVTHDPAQARRLADYAVRIDSGRVVAEGATKELVGA